MKVVSVKKNDRRKWQVLFLQAHRATGILPDLWECAEIIHHYVSLGSWSKKDAESENLTHIY